MFDVQGWLDYIVDSLFNLVKSLWDGILDFFQDFFFYIIEKLMEFSVWVINTFLDPFVPSMNVAALWASVTGPGLSMINYINIPEAIAIIVSALIIRLVLNFIPFVG